MIDFLLEPAGNCLAGSSKQDGVIRELCMVSVFGASIHPDAGEILIVPGHFQLETKNRGLNGTE